MGRSPVSDENGLKKGPWTPEEDQKLVDYIRRNGHGSWRALPKLAGLNRCGKSCRLRWTNYLRPDIKRGKFSDDEEKLIINLHAVLGNKWSTIAGHLPGRTDNEIKNLWNTHLKKKLLKMGIDPVTHRPRTDLNNIFSSLPHLIVAANFASTFLTNNTNSSSSTSTSTSSIAKIQALNNMLQALSTGVPNMETMYGLLAGSSIPDQHQIVHPYAADDYFRSILEQYSRLEPQGLGPVTHFHASSFPNTDETTSTHDHLPLLLPPSTSTSMDNIYPPVTGKIDPCTSKLCSSVDNTTSSSINPGLIGSAASSLCAMFSAPIFNDPLPQLVPADNRNAGTQSDLSDKSFSKFNPINHDMSHLDSSSTFETWADLIDIDKANDSWYWKHITDLASLQTLSDIAE